MKLKANIIVILGLLDIITTLVGIRLGAKEANPLIEPIITTSFGIIIKFFLTSLVALWLYFRHAKKTMVFVILLMCLIILNNLMAIYVMI